ncbi:MAG: response regulator transcription factor [Acidobacteriota bacterium]
MKPSIAKAKTPKANILLVEDEEGLVMTIGDRLRAEGYAVDAELDGDGGLAAGRTGRYDLIILDVMLPGLGGFDVCRELRRHDVDTLILMLTARDQLIDKLLGLKLGADDYLTKPFEPEELVARCEALLRRHGRGASREGRYELDDGVTVDLRRAEVVRDGEVIQLLGKERALLSFLLDRRGEVVRREELLDRVWGYASEVSSRTVDVHIAALRKKIERTPHQPRILQTVHGEGYRVV